MFGKKLKKIFHKKVVRTALVGPDPLHRAIRKIGGGKAAKVINPISEDLRKGRLFHSGKYLGKKLYRKLGLGASSPTGVVISPAGATSAQGVSRRSLSQMTGGF